MWNLIKKLHVLLLVENMQKEDILLLVITMKNIVFI